MTSIKPDKEHTQVRVTNAWHDADGVLHIEITNIYTNPEKGINTTVGAVMYVEFNNLNGMPIISKVGYS